MATFPLASRLAHRHSAARAILRIIPVMRYHSTKNPSHQVDLKTAVLRSLPPDNGLYMPDLLPRLPDSFWENFHGHTLTEIGQTVAAAFFSDDVPPAVLDEMVADTLAFDAPLVALAPDDLILELFHGPSLAFKDFGARFMARLMAWLTRDDPRDLTVLVATSGDTGGAVAAAFHRVPGTRVVILYPTGKVSGLQEKQLTTLGDNITAIEVNGTFDDCQALVKTAFLEPGLGEALHLTSANSINLSRLVPQSFYFISAAAQLGPQRVPTFVVPSGNFGNLTAGLLAARLGMPHAGFVAATNRNDIVPGYLRTGSYLPRPSEATISNAMDVGAPSNFARMQALFRDSWADMRLVIHGSAHTDEATRAAIREVYQRFGYVIDPHGAVGWLAARDWRAGHPSSTTVTLETAHPAKFPDVMEQELGPATIPVPERLARLANLTKSSVRMENNPAEFLSWLRRFAQA